MTPPARPILPSPKMVAVLLVAAIQKAGGRLELTREDLAESARLVALTEPLDPGNRIVLEVLTPQDAAARLATMGGRAN